MGSHGISIISRLRAHFRARTGMGSVEAESYYTFLAVTRCQALPGNPNVTVCVR